MQTFGEICKDCGGLRPKPGVSYSWSGEFCYCGAAQGPREWGRAPGWAIKRALAEEDEIPFSAVFDCPYCKKPIELSKWDG